MNVSKAIFYTCTLILGGAITLLYFFNSLADLQAPYMSYMSNNLSLDVTKMICGIGLVGFGIYQRLQLEKGETHKKTRNPLGWILRIGISICIMIPIGFITALMISGCDPLSSKPCAPLLEKQTTIGILIASVAISYAIWFYKKK